MALVQVQVALDHVLKDCEPAGGLLLLIDGGFGALRPAQQLLSFYEEGMSRSS